MVNDKLLELIHNEIDGLNTPSESARFRKIVADDSEADSLYKNLHALADNLGKSEQQEPPENLKHLVMNSIPRFKYAANKRTSLFEGTLEGIKAQFSWRQTYSFATGIAAGVLLLAIYTGGAGNNAAIDNSDLTGSIVGKYERHGSVFEKRYFSLAEASGSVTTRNSGDNIIVEFMISNGERAQLVFAFDSDALKPIGVLQETNQPVKFSFDSDSIEISAGHTGSYSLIFKRLTTDASEIDVKIQVLDEIINEKLFITQK